MVPAPPKRHDCTGAPTRSDPAGAPVGPPSRGHEVGGSFGALSSFYWSSTSNANNPDNAWNVNFNDGNVNNDNDKDNHNYVRAVRRGT